MVRVRLFPNFAVWALACVAAVLSGFFGSTAEAQSARGWSICNATSYVIQVSSGRPEGSGIVVQGWTKIRPGGCEVLLPAPLLPGAYYLYAESSEAHRGGKRIWGGDEDLCVEGLVSFAIESLPDCNAMGLDVRQFRPVLVENRNRWSTVIREANKYTLDQASAAGVQRLMGDAGVFAGAIDGNRGARTGAAVRGFLRERGLPTDTDDQDLIDILEQLSLDRARNVGLTVCNRTDQRVWTAVGRRNGDGWESRGWWLLEAGGCSRVVDEPLLQAEHFVYGELETDDPRKVRKLIRGSDTFCVGRSKFVIPGREDCGASAYRSELFVATEIPRDRKLVFEFFERDFGE